MVIKDLTPLEQINARRAMLHIKKIVESATQAHIFEPKDNITKDSIHKMIAGALNTVPDCNLIKTEIQPPRSQLRKSMNKSDQIIDILTEEIDGNWDGDRLKIDIEFTPVKAAESIELNFTVT